MDRHSRRTRGLSSFIFHLSSCLRHLVLILLGAFFVLPFYWLVSTALKSDAEVFAVPPVWIPKELRWHNFLDAVSYVPFFLYLKNTLVICMLSVAGTLVSS